MSSKCKALSSDPSITKKNTLMVIFPHMHEMYLIKITLSTITLIPYSGNGDRAGQVSPKPTGKQ
jgi:hypothetical protein